jgi:hypothetical protein
MPTPTIPTSILYFSSFSVARRPWPPPPCSPPPTGKAVTEAGRLRAVRGRGGGGGGGRLWGKEGHWTSIVGGFNGGGGGVLLLHPALFPQHHVQHGWLQQQAHTQVSPQTSEAATRTSISKMRERSEREEREPEESGSLSDLTSLTS